MRKLAILFILSPIIIVGGFFLLLKWIDFSETQDSQANNYTRQVCSKLFDYYFKNNRFPSTLNEIGDEEKYVPASDKTYFMKYKPSDSNQDFRLAMKLTPAYISLYEPSWKGDYIDKKNKTISPYGCEPQFKHIIEEDYPSKLTSPEKWPSL